MLSFFSIIALGFFLGMRHATDPDHVIAVSTIVARQRNIKRSALIGAFWGVGHTLTILLVGAAIILFDLVIPPRIGLSMELCVGLMLIILGLMNITSFLRSMSSPTLGSAVRDLESDLPASDHVHAGDHSHADPSGVVHSHDDGHPHSHNGEGTPVAYLDRTLGRVTAYQYARPLIIGIVHGLAGSAAVALLVLTTIRNPYWSVAYLLIFGIGTIAGMMLITMSIASAFSVVNRSRTFARGLAMASGVLSLGFGLVVAYQIGIVNGLFTGHPNWTPR